MRCLRCSSERTEPAKPLELHCLDCGHRWHRAFDLKGAAAISIIHTTDEEFEAACAAEALSSNVEDLGVSHGIEEPERAILDPQNQEKK